MPEMDGWINARQAPGHRPPQPRNSWVWVGGSLVLARASRCTDPRRPQTSRFTHVAGDYSGRVRESQETKGGVCIPIILRTERRSQASDPQDLDRVSKLGVSAGAENRQRTEDNVQSERGPSLM
jgi:hypothetical protein